MGQLPDRVGRALQLLGDAFQGGRQLRVDCAGAGLLVPGPSRFAGNRPGAGLRSGRSRLLLGFLPAPDESADAKGESADRELADERMHVTAVAAGKIAAAVAFAGGGGFPGLTAAGFVLGTLGSRFGRGLFLLLLAKFLERVGKDCAAELVEDLRGHF